MAAKVGGLWSEETATFFAALAQERAESCPFVLQGRVKAAWIRRWSAMLACSAARAFTVSLLNHRPVPGAVVVRLSGSVTHISSWSFFVRKKVLGSGFSVSVFGSGFLGFRGSRVLAPLAGAECNYRKKGNRLRVGCDGFHPKTPWTRQKKHEDKLWSYWKKGGKWPQQACTTLFFVRDRSR